MEGFHECELRDAIVKEIASDLDLNIRTAVLNALENDVANVLNQHLYTSVANALEKEKLKIPKDSNDQGEI
jgi:hypothetical protein